MSGFGHSVKIIFIIFVVFILAFAFANFFINNDFIEKNMIKLDSKIVGSRWIYHKLN